MQPKPLYYATVTHATQHTAEALRSVADIAAVWYQGGQNKLDDLAQRIALQAAYPRWYTYFYVSPPARRPSLDDSAEFFGI